jgi:hypothetical protein
MLDPDRIRQHFGVSKLPIPLPPVRTTEFYPREYLGSGRSEPVLVTIDLNEAGGVDDAQAILPPSLPSGKGIRAILSESSGERHIDGPGRSESARILDPLFARAAEASIRQMHFSPAELDGKPVAFTGLRMTIVLSDPAAQPA